MHDHVDVRRKDGDVERDQTDAGELSRARDQERDAETDLANAAHPNQNVRPRESSRYDPDEERRIDEVERTDGDHRDRQNDASNYRQS
jgi:hypothetical protein